MNMQQRNSDNSWSPVEPLGWQHVPGGDWEVYTTAKPKRAELFYEELLMEVVTARTRIGLALKMRRARRKHGIADPVTSSGLPTQPTDAPDASEAAHG